MFIKEELKLDKYLPFKYNNSTTKSEILKNTKKLIKNTEKYTKYLRTYTSHTQVTSFKLPEVISYPIFKNVKLIPVSKINFNISNENKNENESYNKESNFKTAIKKSNTLSKLNNENDLLNKNNSPILHTSSNEINISPNLKSSLKDKFQRLISTANNQNLRTENKLGLNELEFFTSDHKLSYDANLIFNKQNFYEELIKNKIEYFKNNKNENITTSLTKRINHHNLKEVNVTLNSIKIEFKNLSNKLKPNLHFYFPLAILPILYFNDIEMLKIILLFVVKFNKDFDEIILEEENIYKILNFMKEFKSDNKIEENKKFFLLKKNKENIFIFNWITELYAYEVEIK